MLDVPLATVKGQSNRLYEALRRGHFVLVADFDGGPTVPEGLADLVDLVVAEDHDPGAPRRLDRLARRRDRNPELVDLAARARTGGLRWPGRLSGPSAGGVGDRPSRRPQPPPWRCRTGRRGAP